jgi:hypothetical protein
VTRPPRRPGARLLGLAGATLLMASCGHAGPPLPPLVRLPVEPGEVTLVRRGPRVDLSFRVPDANTDRSTPADLSRVDVYAIDAPAPVTADDVIRRGSKIKSLTVIKPRDEDEPEPEKDAPKPEGLEQKQVATVSDPLPEAADAAAYRAYVVVPYNMRGRRGTPSTRVAVPLVPPPPAPAEPRVTYDDKAVKVAWTAVPAPSGAGRYSYSVYRSGSVPVPLTPKPIAELAFSDDGVEWETERCYEVRTVAIVEGVRIESEPSPSHCVTLHDTFPPAKPEGLVGVGSEGSVSLIWTPNRDADLAGYVVLRAIAPATDLTPVTRTPIPDTNFRDTVPSGSRVTYAVVAVDKAGNRSAPSESITETSR